MCDMKMVDMGPSERPREKLMEKGPDALSDGELLSIILRVGRAGENVADMSRRLLAGAGNTLTGLFSMSMERMCEIKGMGPCKTASVQAALELGRRFAAEGTGIVKRPITTSEMVYDMMRPVLKGLRREECWAVYLNHSNYVLEKCRITVGADDQTTMDIRQIVRKALDKTASSIILAHNHPSGNPNPSEADIKFTGQLHDALSSFGLALLDHIIVSDDCYFSFSDDMMHYRK